MRFLSSCAFVMLVAASASVHAFEPFVVKDIRVEGIQRTDAGTVFSYLPVKVGETLTEARLRPSVNISEMRGLGPNEQLRLGRSVVAFGPVAPSWLAGEKVRFALEKKTRRGQRVQVRAQRVITDDSTISWKVTPGTRGRYIITVKLAATADHPGAGGASWWFTVR